MCPLHKLDNRNLQQQNGPCKRYLSWDANLSVIKTQQKLLEDTKKLYQCKRDESADSIVYSKSYQFEIKVFSDIKLDDC